MKAPRRLLHLFNISNKKKYFARKLIGYSRNEMYKVVSDVRNYENFVPFCTKSTIISEKPLELRANLEVGFPPIIENYTSVVSLIPNQAVLATCRDGRLFTLLETNWRFSPGLKSNLHSCIVDFHINFEFKSVLYSQVATFFFDQLVQQMEMAFINEAKRRYGKESIPIRELDAVKS